VLNVYIFPMLLHDVCAVALYVMFFLVFFKQMMRCVDVDDVFCVSVLDSRIQSPDAGEHM